MATACTSHTNLVTHDIHQCVLILYATILGKGIALQSDKQLLTSLYLDLHNSGPRLRLINTNRHMSKAPNAFKNTLKSQHISDEAKLRREKSVEREIMGAILKR